MSEKLIIKNFGPIKDVELDLRKLNVFIGDQGTGKSTVAKIIAIMYDSINIKYGRISAGLISSINGEYSEIDSKTIQDSFKLDLKQYNISEFIEKNSEIYFDSAFCEFHYNEQNSTYKYLPKSTIHTESKYPLNSVYIPTERNLLSLVKINIYAFNRMNMVLPDYFLNYAQLINRINENLLEIDLSDILGVHYVVNNEGDVTIRSNNNKILKLSESSSGIQSLSSILVYFEYLLSLEPDKGSDKYERLFSLLVEEPELNVFPNVQKKTMEKLALVSNKFPTFSISLTTHSPYILTSLNNLMYAYTVGNIEEKEVAVNSIVDKHYWLNPNDVSAYMFGNGKCEDILDREEGMIMAEKIDSVSEKLNYDFDKLIKTEHNF